MLFTTFFCLCTFFYRNIEFFLIFIFCFFFFKQKTAYEMRISDWSSDVCSSDLFGLPIYQHPMESNLTLAAQMLRDAYQGPPIAPMRRFLDPLDVEGAYAVQALNTRHWLAEGRVLVGRK